MRKLTKTAAVVASMAVMAMGTAVMTSAAQEGWVQSGSNWYYYINGKAVENQWVLAGEDWYFLGDDGKMVTYAFIEDNEVETDYTTLTGGDIDEPVYFVGADGKMAKGWVNVDYYLLKESDTTPINSKSYYYFGGSGEMFGDQWVSAGEDWYYLSSDGTMAETDFDESGKYYLTKDGAMACGWYKLKSDDAKSLFGESNKAEFTGKYIYTDADGEIQTGWVKDNGKWYYLDETSTERGDVALMHEGFLEKQVDTTSADESKTNTFYLQEKSGAMATGYTKIDKYDYRFFDKSTGAMKTKSFQTINNRYYWFEADGTSLSDASEDKKDVYYYIKEAKTSNGVEIPEKERTFPTTGSAATLGANLDEVATKVKKDGKSGMTYTIYKLGSSSSKTVKIK